MSNLGEYIEKKEIKSGFDKLPEGDTVLDLKTTKVEETSYEGEPKWNLQTTDGKNYTVGVKIMQGIKKIDQTKFSKARITRQGLKKEDTTYTVLGVN